MHCQNCCPVYGTKTLVALESRVMQQRTSSVTQRQTDNTTKAVPGSSDDSKDNIKKASDLSTSAMNLPLGSRVRHVTFDQAGGLHCVDGFITAYDSEADVFTMSNDVQDQAESFTPPNHNLQVGEN